MKYVAMLRGVSPMNAKMPELKAAFESAGFTEVRTVLSSGNVLFQAPTNSEAALERKAEAAMKQRLGKSFLTIIRPVEELEKILASNPYKKCKPIPGEKRVVTFLRENPKTKLKLPIELDGSRILATKNREVFSAYVVSPRGPVFMSLIEKTFGKNVTTRTWDTVKKLTR